MGHYDDESDFRSYSGKAVPCAPNVSVLDKHAKNILPGFLLCNKGPAAPDTTETLRSDLQQMLDRYSTIVSVGERSVTELRERLEAEERKLASAKSDQAAVLAVIERIKESEQ